MGFRYHNIQQQSAAHTHPWALFAVFLTCSTKFTYWKNVAEAWQQGYRSVCFLAQYSFLHHKEVRAKRRWKSILFPGS